MDPALEKIITDIMDRRHNFTTYQPCTESMTGQEEQDAAS